MTARVSCIAPNVGVVTLPPDWSPVENIPVALTPDWSPVKNIPVALLAYY
jgi:hypothetical protein